MAALYYTETYTTQNQIQISILAANYTKESESGSESECKSAIIPRALESYTPVALSTSSAIAFSIGPIGTTTSA